MKHFNEENPTMKVTDSGVAEGSLTEQKRNGLAGILVSTGSDYDSLKCRSACGDELFRERRDKMMTRIYKSKKM